MRPTSRGSPRSSRVSPVQSDLLVRASRAVIGGREVAASISVRDGRIVAIDSVDARASAEVAVELGPDEVLLPGLVDTHVHVNEPGRTEWEGFASATRAAAAGGITTIVDMPLNSIPPTVDVAALEIKRRVAADQSVVNVGFWGGAVPGNVEQLRPLHEAGVFGFKCFLLASGVDEFPPLTIPELEKALIEIASFDGLMIVHAENAEVIAEAPSATGREYSGFLESRPRAAENRAIEQVIELSRRTGCRVHILHLSSADALPMIAAAKRDGVRVTVETCPHYLCFDAEAVPAGATQFKCCPPIREAGNRELLWQGLSDGTIDTIVTDHSPCTPDLKRFDTGDFGDAWGGIASLQVSLAAVWTEARARGFALTDIVRWMATNTADQVGMADRGRIDIGCAADLVVFAPDERFTVDVAQLYHRNPVTAYDRLGLSGVVRRSWIAGSESSTGRLLARA
ncbi:allantoinase AllB [Rhodococcus sp. 14-2496-1d]|uniref:allantoinase AllB n=1 Tax=Rhodococcus sp. 14-2496-1d TaxID=2023146 RepID=UPI000B9B4EA4|nr:allantoinase AllB [Rhodococcus sp. 14-2496-1d]OZF34745.1 allantoinase AllB [Rhodococcus sp. 14-2496-1d]